MTPTPENFLADARNDPALAAFVRQTGPCRLPRRRPQGAQEKTHEAASDDALDPYVSLVRAVAGQQLHEKAAARIYERLCALNVSALNGNGEIAGASLTVPPAPRTLLALGEEPLRACGLSRAKTAAVLGLARARLEGVVPDLAEAHALDDAALIARLTALRGIGPWTVEMFLIFTLGRPDVMPAGDYGVQEGWRRIQGAQTRLTPARLLEATARFSPYRSALAWYCWRAKERLPP